MRDKSCCERVPQTGFEDLVAGSTIPAKNSLPLPPPYDSCSLAKTK